MVGAQNHARIIYGYGTVGDKETLLGKILILAPGSFGARNKLSKSGGDVKVGRVVGDWADAGAARKSCRPVAGASAVP